MSKLCIYHGNCADGFSGAWVVRKALGDIEFHAGVYQNAPPDVTGKDVVLVDFSYKRAEMEQIVDRAKSVLVLDHHKTVFSLRSTDDGPDVSDIAKQYGGGGHPHASGFRVPYGHELAR